MQTRNLPLTRRQAGEPYLERAIAALDRYPLRVAEVVYLGHSDNMTFRVAGPDGALYLLRLHRPVLAYWAGIRQLPEVIASELAWLEALAAQGGFYVQQPVRTRDGDLVAVLGLPGEEPLPATLLTWLPGSHFSPGAPGANPDRTAALVERYGELVARLHAFSAGWNPPAGLIRPEYDYDHFNRIFSRLSRGVDLGIYSEEIYWMLRAACQLILNEISALPDDPEHWGMIHADLHVGNFLVEGERVFPIDFSFCGFGHYLFDLSVCLTGGLLAGLRPVFLRGYRSVRPLPESELRAVEAYALAGRLSYYAYQVDNPAERAWLQRRIPEVVQNECARFLRGDTILWNI